MSKVKICGLSRDEDIAMINKYRPDYCGFIVDFPKSHRSVDLEKLAHLTAQVDEGIVRVGVFVNYDAAKVAELLNSNVIDIAQLHGGEDEAYIEALRKLTDKPIIKAFTVKSHEDVENAVKSSADYILLDQGKGSGKVFDWSLIGNVEREYFLAGGLDADNIGEAIKSQNPYAVDLSSGVETDKIKDESKVAQVIEIVRGA